VESLFTCAELYRLGNHKEDPEIIARLFLETAGSLVAFLRMSRHEVISWALCVATERVTFLTNEHLFVSEGSFMLRVLCR
jgi:hypothetical protein